MGVTGQFRDTNTNQIITQFVEGEIIDFRPVYDANTPTNGGAVNIEWSSQDYQGNKIIIRTQSVTLVPGTYVSGSPVLSVSFLVPINDPNYAHRAPDFLTVTCTAPNIGFTIPVSTITRVGAPTSSNLPPTEPPLPAPFNDASYMNLINGGELLTANDIAAWGTYNSDLSLYPGGGMQLKRPTPNEAWQSPHYAVSLKAGDTVLLRYLGMNVSGSGGLRAGMDFRPKGTNTATNQVLVKNGNWISGNNWQWVDQIYTITAADITAGVDHVTMWLQAGLSNQTTVALVNKVRFYIKSGSAAPPPPVQTMQQKQWIFHAKSIFPGYSYNALTANNNSLLISLANGLNQAITGNGWSVVQVTVDQTGYDVTLTVDFNETGSPLLIALAVIVVGFILIFLLKVGAMLVDWKIQDTKTKVAEANASIAASDLGTAITSNQSTFDNAVLDGVNKGLYTPDQGAALIDAAHKNNIPAVLQGVNVPGDSGSGGTQQNQPPSWQTIAIIGIVVIGAAMALPGIISATKGKK